MTLASKVHIIIVNFRTWQHTIKCLKSIKSGDYPDYKISVVDIAGLDNSYQNISWFLNANKQLNAELISLSVNKGFANANNAILKKIINGDEDSFVWLLNNDTEIKTNTLSELVKSYVKLQQDNEHPGIIGSKIMDAHFPEIIQIAGGIFDPKNGLIKFIDKGKNDNDPIDALPRKVDFVIGASMFLSTEVLRKIGLMDERYFLYCEDIDWCTTAQIAGFTNFVCPSSIVFHEQGASTGTKYEPRNNMHGTLKYLHTSYLLFYKKFYPKHLAVAGFQLTKKMISQLLRGRFAESKMIFEVLRKNLILK